MRGWLMSEFLQDIFDVDALSIKKKSNKTRNLRDVAGRVTKGAPEVMVKITGFARGEQHVKSHMTYISRHGKVELEDNNGMIISGKEEVQELSESWSKDITETRQRKSYIPSQNDKNPYRKKEQRDLMRLVLSMPSGVNAEAVRSSVREFAKETFGDNHDYVFALHEDTNSPHCHITVRCKGHNGRKLDPKKADLQTWRENFAEKLRERGVAAEATPRKARGVVKKAQKIAIKHIEKGSENREPRVSKVRARKIKEISEELTGRREKTDRPWESAIKEQQTRIRQSWMKQAEALEKEKTPESLALAKNLRQFVADMPPVETERQQMERELRTQFKRKEKTQVSEKKPKLQKTPTLERTIEAERKIGAERAAPRKGKKKDLER